MNEPADSSSRSIDDRLRRNRDDRHISALRDTPFGLIMKPSRLSNRRDFLGDQKSLLYIDKSAAPLTVSPDKKEKKDLYAARRRGASGPFSRAALVIDRAAQ